MIAGPLSASHRPPAPAGSAAGPRTLFAGGLYNFGEVHDRRRVAAVRLIDKDGTVMFTHTIAPE